MLGKSAENIMLKGFAPFLKFYFFVIDFEC